MTASLPAAVLWDLDGTLVDTEPFWLAAELAMVESFGGSWSHAESLELVGQGLWHTARVMQGKGVSLEEWEIIDRLTSEVLDRVSESVPWRPGARELLLEFKAAGVPAALVTMSIRRMADHIADAIGAFDVVVAGDDVTHAKPHPEPYLRAAELLGVPIERCVAFEDSEPGLASATAAGAAVIGVPHIIDLPKGDGHAIWPTLAGATLADVVAEFASRRAS